MNNLTQRGRTWHYDGTYGESRLRFSLGVIDAKAATRLANRVTFAISDGPRSGVWPELQKALPSGAWEILVREFRLQQCPGLGAFERTYYDKIERRLKLGEISLNTRKLYLKVAERFFGRMSDIGIGELGEVSASVIESYLLWRKEQIQTRTPGSDARSLVTEKTVLSTIFNLAMEDGVIRVSPVKDFVRPEAECRGAEPFTDEEMDRMNGATDDQDRLLFLLFRWTGLRVSDVSDLRWSSINWTERTLKVRTRKRGVTVTIPIVAELEKALTEYLFMGDPFAPENNHIFLDSTPGKLYNVIRKLGEKSGVSKAFPHRFRDSLSVHMLSKGATLYDVGKVLGDQISTVEKHYAPFVEKLQERVRGILEAA